MIEIVTIEGRLPSLNELIGAINHNRFAGNKMKQDVTTLCEMAFRTQCPSVFEKAYIHFHWIEANKKRDKDNIASAKKFILDGMQKAGVIANDNWKFIEGFSDKFSVDKENPRVEITITEISYE